MRNITLPVLLVVSLLASGAQAATVPTTAPTPALEKLVAPQVKQLHPLPSPNMEVGTAIPLGSAPSFAREPDAAAPAAPAAPKKSKLTCPVELRSLVSVDSDDSANWSVGGNGQIALLKGARLFTGPLSEKTIERYNELTAIPLMNREKGEFQQIWTLDEKLIKAGVLVVCDYSGSNHFLMRAVPEGTKECRETDAVEHADTTPTTFSCE